MKRFYHSVKIVRLLCVTLCILMFKQHVVAQEIKQGMWKGREVEYIDGQILIKVRNGVTRDDLIQLASGMVGSTLGPGPDALRWILLRLPSGADVFSTMDILMSNPLVEICAPSLIGYPLDDPYDPNDTYYLEYQWPLYNRGDICDPPPFPVCCVAGEDLNVRKAWDITLGSPAIPIAVLDSGIPLDDNLALNHPELDGEGNRIILGQDYVINYLGDNNDPSVRDVLGHGTRVAGIIAAQTDNDTGIAGVAGGCKLQIFQVMNFEGDASDGAFKDAVMAAVDAPFNARVINASLHFPESDPIKDAIAYAQSHGVLVIAATHEGAFDIGWPAELASSYDNVIAVGSMVCDGCFDINSPASSKISVLTPGGGEDYYCFIGASAQVITTNPPHLPGNPAAGYYLGSNAPSFAAPVLSGNGWPRIIRKPRPHSISIS